MPGDEPPQAALKAEITLDASTITPFERSPHSPVGLQYCVKSARLPGIDDGLAIAIFPDRTHQMNVARISTRFDMGIMHQMCKQSISSTPTARAGRRVCASRGVSIRAVSTAMIIKATHAAAPSRRLLMQTLSI